MEDRSLRTQPVAAPHLLSWRAARGTPETELNHDALARAGRRIGSGWHDIERGTAHLVVGYRETCGLAAPCWTRRRLLEWLNELDDDAMDALADELLQEAEKVAERLRGREEAA